MPVLAPPTHLAIFVTDPEDGNPVQRLPLYVEVAAPRIVPPRPPADYRLREPIFAAIGHVDPSATGVVFDRAIAAALAALGQAVTDASLNALLFDLEKTRAMMIRVFKQVLHESGSDRLAQVPDAALDRLVLEAVRRQALEFELELVEEPKDAGVIWAEPLGVLTTDHAGYASFDLTRLSPGVRALLGEVIAARRLDPDAEMKLAIWIHPYGSTQRYEVLGQARFAFDAVVARLERVWHTLPPSLINMGPRALQNPGLTDWRLSPASFAASPKTLVGEDGCEELVPASLALQQFMFRQVVRLTDIPADFGIPVNAGFRAAYVDEYKVSWFSLGHSLGEILYSLPLAPGETVKLAVIDWSWDSLTQRDETTKLTENLLHQTHRDRTITETVKAGLQELQHGSSFMGGMAGSGGATGGANLGVVGLGAAVGHAWSVGGSTATSEGSRDLAAENVQRVNDSFSQASSAQRELNSTVVIQARQEETESIQTRTFSNYNHSHTLTVLYYEVLRHFRVTVEWMRRRPAVLAKVPARLTALDDATLLRHRFLLEPALLDPGLKTGFDALEKREALAHYQALHGIDPAVQPPAPWWEGNVELELFQIGIWTNDDTVNNITVFVITAEDHARSNANVLHYVYKGSSPAGPNYGAHNINSGERMETDQEQHTFLKLAGQEVNGESRRIPWSKVLGFQFEKWGDTEWRIDALSIRAWDRFGFLVDFTPGRVDTNLFILGREPGSQAFSDIKRPGPPPPPIARVLSPDQSLSQEEAHQIKRLREHVAARIDYYASVIQFGTDATQIARAFEVTPWATTTMDDYVDPTPLEVFGSYVAYPLVKLQSKIDDALVVDLAAALNGTDPAARQKAAADIAAMSAADQASVLERLPLASAKSERLISLPTRGVFAEGKLGHCNVSEEIDETRFWRWDEHPIPIEAPEIGTIDPIRPEPQAVAVQPTAFPQSLLNIVNPSPAPDPAGLAAALSLLGTPNIFRDMSGQKEVADLLKKLSDNSISIAEAANRAREIQAKYGTDLDKQQKDYDLGAYKATTEAEGKVAEAEARRAEAQASRAEAEAQKSNIQAGVQQAEAAKHLPKPLREPVQQAAANTLAGNPVKEKVVVFKALGFNGQTLEGWFGLAVRDVMKQQDVIAELKVGPYFDRPVTFKAAEPVIEARVSRKDTIPIKILDEVIYVPAIDVVSSKESFTVGKSHRIINLTLAQASRDVQFKATSTNTAVDELMNKWGVELGVNKVVAAKIIADYEKKNAITHSAAEEKSYTINVPTQNYELKISSKA
jgi:hypothetical protein